MRSVPEGGGLASTVCSLQPCGDAGRQDAGGVLEYTAAKPPHQHLPLHSLSGSEAETYSLAALLYSTLPPLSIDGEVSYWVRMSLLFTSYQAGFSITLFSVSLTIRL